MKSKGGVKPLLQNKEKSHVDRKTEKGVWGNF